MQNQKSPISAKELRRKLNQGSVKFVFEKKDGSLRTAYGTRNINLIPEGSEPKGGETSPQILAFYDLENRGWRSLNVMSQIELA